jgi:hypothetical protein
MQGKRILILKVEWPWHFDAFALGRYWHAAGDVRNGLDFGGVGERSWSPAEKR